MYLGKHSGVGVPSLGKEGAEALGVRCLMGLSDFRKHSDGFGQSMSQRETDPPLLVYLPPKSSRCSASPKLGGLIDYS